MTVLRIQYIYMKKTGLISVIVCLTVELMAQTDSSRVAAWRIDKYYGNAGVVNRDPGIFARIATGVYFGNRLGVSADGLLTYYKAKNIPSNYSAGFCLFGCTPEDAIQSYSLQISKEFRLSGGGASLVLGAGPAYVIYDETRFKHVSSSSVFGGNYDTYSNLHRSLGLVLNPKLHIRPFKNIAFDLGWFSNFNHARAIHGVDISFVAGLLRYRTEIPKGIPRLAERGDSLRNIKRSILNNDSLRTRQQRRAALMQMQFQPVSTPQLRRDYYAFYDRGTSQLAFACLATGLGAFIVARGINAIPENLDRGLGISLIGFSVGSGLGTVLFVSSGRNLRKAKRIDREIIRRKGVSLARKRAGDALY